MWILLVCVRVLLISIFKGRILCFFAYQKPICLLCQKSRRTQTDKDVTHNIRLDSEGQGFIQRGEVQQPLPEYRIDYDAPRVAHRSCSALRCGVRPPARARTC